MKSYHFSLLTALMSIVSICATAHDIEVANNDGVTIYYVYANTAKTELAVSYRGSSYSKYPDEYSGHITIPGTVTYNDKTMKVTRIINNAFFGCTGLTSIEIPSSVTTISPGAFQGCI